MKRVIRIVVVLLVVAGIAAAGYWFYTTRMTPTANTPTSFTQIVPVTEGNLSDSLSVVGELDSIQSQELQFTRLDEAAELVSVEVKTGNTVKAGQVLATIDPTPFEQALEQAKTELAAAEKTLAELQTPATSLAMAQADLAIAKADYQLQKAKQDAADLQTPDLTELQANLQDAQDKLARLDFDKQLAERDTLAKTERDLGYTIDWYQRRIAELKNQDKKNAEEMQEYEDRQVELADLWAEMSRVQSQRALAKTSLGTEERTYQAAIAEAQAALNDARAGGGDLDLAKAQLAIREAEVALTEAQDARASLDTGASASDLATAQADVEKKRLAVKNAEEALEGTELKAPFDGTILDIDGRAGDKITANTVIMTIANLTEMQVYASVDETTIRRIKEGQEAQISFDAFPGQTFKGKVLSVPLQGTLQNDVMVYQVPLSLEGTEDLPLLVGMTANVAIQTAQADNALLVPSMALQRNRGEYMLMVVNPNDPEGDPIPTPVEVGLSDGVFTQIVEGVKAGDQVVMTVQPTNNSPFGGFSAGGGAIFVAPAGGGAFPGGGTFRQGGGPGNFGGGGGNRGGNNNTRP